MKTFLSKRFLAGFVVVAVGAACGSAFAFWSSTGTGSGNAKALSAQNVTVNAVTGTADLYPGASGKVYFTLTNPNPYPITFTDLEGGTVVSGNTTSCPSLNVTSTDVTGLTLNVAANSTSAMLSVPAVVTMEDTAPDGCQGIVFTVALALTGTQV